MKRLLIVFVSFLAVMVWAGWCWAPPLPPSTGGATTTYVNAGLALKQNSLNKTTVSTYAELSASITALTAGGGTIVATAPITLTAAVTVPATITFEQVKGAIITLGAYNLAINGPTPSDGLYQRYNQNSTGIVTFLTPPIPVKSVWFGPDFTDAPIRSAIKSLPASTGGEVVVRNGTYAITVAIPIVDRSNVTISGESKDGAVLECNSLLTLDPSLPASGTWGYDGGTPQWGIIHIDGTAEANISKNITIRNLTLRMGTTNWSQSQKTIFYGQVENLVVEDCNIYGGYWEAVYGHAWSYSATGTHVNPTGIWVRRNYFGSTALGEQFRANSYGISNGHITDNYFDHTNGTGSISCAWSGRDVEISRNTFYRVKNWAIELGEGARRDNCLVANNRFIQTGYGSTSNARAIKVVGTTGPWVDQEETTTTRGVLITNNIITDMIGNCIAIQSSGPCSIVNNVISGVTGNTSSNAISIEPSTDIATYPFSVYVTGNIVENTNNLTKWQGGIGIGNPTIGDTSAYANMTVYSSGNNIGDIASDNYAMLISSSDSFPNIYISNDILNGKILGRKNMMAQTINDTGVLNNVPITVNNVNALNGSASFAYNLALGGSLTSSGTISARSSGNSNYSQISASDYTASLDLVSNAIGNYRRIRFGYGATPTFGWSIGYGGWFPNTWLVMDNAISGGGVSISGNNNLLVGGTSATDMSGTGGLRVEGTTEATSLTDASLQTAGGGAITKNLLVGGNIQVGTVISPITSGGSTLGTALSPFNGAFFSINSVLDWGNGVIALTPSTDKVTWNVPVHSPGWVSTGEDGTHYWVVTNTGWPTTDASKVDGNIAYNGTTQEWGVYDGPFGAWGNRILSEGKVDISSDADGMTAAEMTAVGLRGTCFLATGSGTWILPTAVAGMSACLEDTGTNHDLILDLQTADDIMLNGTTQAASIGITNAATTTTGDRVCVTAIASGHWKVREMQGVWASQ